MERLNRLLTLAGQRQDVVFVSVMLIIVAMMVIPIPTIIVDIMLAGNMTITILLLMTAIYLKSPLDFSTLPAVVLVTTIFRLSLSITTTRLILTKADAGNIIEAFGQFVVSGSVGVGIIIFLIITIVNFMVITKGSERVAEVSARFTLDALPGKQMSIDSDLRSGDIDKDEARKRRSTLEKESQFYGAMDGAMKFVKGDAIAGLIIVAVNLIGGISIGILSKGMSFGEATQVFSILTIGDGLVGQIPALLISISCGAIVTRVTTEESRNLGADITRQIFRDPKAIRIAAVVLTALCFVPGFPWPVFMVLAAAFGTASFMDFRKDQAEKKEKQEAKEKAEAEANEPKQASAEEAKPNPGDIFVAQLAPGLFDSLDMTAYATHSQDLREDIQAQLGVPFPRVGLVRNAALEGRQFRIDVEGVPVFESSLPADMVYLRDGKASVADMGLEVSEHPPVRGKGPSYWVSTAHDDQLTEAGVSVLSVSEALAASAISVEQRYASHILGLQETQELLNQMQETHKDLVGEARKLLNPQKSADVFRRLLDEGISLGNVRTLMEAVIEWAPREEDPAMLTEYIRSALKRQISHQYADSNKVIHTYLLEGDAEEAVRRSVRRTSVGSYLALDENSGRVLLSNLKAVMDKPVPEGVQPVILTALDVRRFVRSFVQNNNLGLPVLSYQELSPEFTVQPLGSVNMRPPDAEAAA